MKSACLYARWSPRPVKLNGAGQVRECESNITQLDRLRDYCRANAWQIIAEEQDEEKSGSTTDGRPGLERAMVTACNRKAVLLVYSLSRLARNTRDALNLTDRLDRAGADLASLHEKIDTTSAMGRCLFTIMAAVATLEREQTAERVSDGIRRRMADGQRMGPRGLARPFGNQGSCLPYGKRVDPADESRVVDDADELAAMAEVQRLAAEGRGLREIARLMEARGPWRGHRWHHVIVGRIVKRIIDRPLNGE